MQNVRTVWPVLGRLQTVVEVGEAAALGPEVRARWEMRRKLVEGNSFEYVEPVLKARQVALQAVGARAQLLDEWLGYSRLARQANMLHLARAAASAMEGLAENSGAWLAETARIHWHAGDTDTALRLVRVLVSGPLAEDDPELHTRATMLYGSWLAERRIETAHVIIDQYLRRGVELTAAHDRAHVSTAHHTLAAFADSQYQAMVANMSSAQWDAAQAVRDQTRSEYDACVKAKRDSKARPDSSEMHELRRHLTQLEKQVVYDAATVRTATDNRDSFLDIALRNYALCLQHGDDFNTRVFRLVSLWFANPDPAISALVDAHASPIPSHKFLPLMYQLAARMDACPAPDMQPFHATLTKLIARVCKDHPYHTLHIILALCKGNAHNSKAVDTAKVCV